MTIYTGFTRYVYDFQTLLGGVTALIAALVATRYIRWQMKLSTRELLIGRGRKLAERRHETRALLTEVTKMQRHLRPWEDETVEPEPTWAHAAGQVLDAIIATLREHQDTSLDGQKIDRSRKDLIASCELLSRCLYDVHAIQSIDFGGFKEPPRSEESAYATRAALARGQIEVRLSRVAERAKTLDNAFDSRLSDVWRELHKLQRLAF